MSASVSRRSFLQLAGAGLAASSLGAAPVALAAAPANAVAVDHKVYLNFNECPLGPSPAALQAMSRGLASTGRYRFELAGQLRDLMATQLGVPAERLRLYPGSSDPLNRAGHVFTSPQAAVVVPDPTFEAVAEVAAAHGAPVRKVPLATDFSHDVEAMAAVDPRAGLIYVCNPNNPTGSVTPRARIEWLLAHKPADAVVLVDEAYIHYSEQPSVVDLAATRDDLVVLRTFSKLYGMAGLRLGAAVASPGLLGRLDQIGENPLPVPALLAAEASLRDGGLVPTRRAANARIRQQTVDWLQAQGYACIPSESNCFMVDIRADGQAFAQAMAAQDVVVGRSWPIWPQRVRVTVGTEAEMQRFRAAFASVLKGGG
ncbi:pyridoxal phosphate-dependent aminotransferase [Stenotrophomonas sp. HITSZ_GD]|uniref:pyridoxal phosphate-dependent aminotransferase n=1 Tax=Stenotrophomonas sp. HITSZ_GD TaxID=3037248 RepID=UPI00240DAB0F|nr:pyridoxal phosphate-dependent aminotransferase [Stenotrophomonas sp. HITSZ_GD]MDG2526632.1 pyridoxal phosphate-dependent aminotransferase [Stenotrophomonas sp. HITSZ_GD]